MSASNQALWRSRIVATGEADPAELRANPQNWRRHPAGQRAVLGEMLDQVGWVTEVILNRTTGHLVDGHLRVEMAADKHEPTIPVTYVELTEEEERLVLAAFDPIGQLATADNDKLRSLVDGLSIDGDLDTLLTGLLPEAPPEDEKPGDLLEAMSVSLGDPDHQPQEGEVWRVGNSWLVIANVYDGWPLYTPLLAGDRLLVPYPTPVLPLTDRAQKHELVMVQPDAWLAGHMLDKYVEVYGEDQVGKAR